MIMEIEQWIKEAYKAAKNAYAPYSNYAVGAVVALKDGTLIYGCNIENAAYGSTMCAERNAIYQTYCRGYHKEDIISLTIAVSGNKIATPCGACRQVLAELMDSRTPIILACESGYEITNIETLLPGAFLQDNLNI